MYEIITRKLPKRLKVLRELHNYTQEYVSFELKISQAGYANLENGKTVISLDKIEKICSIYDLTIDEFFEFDLNEIIKRKNISV